MPAVLLSYIIPCYNMEQYLGDCLDSILEQDLKPGEYEVIIVNDGSQDNTLQIALDYAHRHSNFYVIDKQNSGVGAARNSGLGKAKGKYLYFLDPDDYLAKGCMHIAISIAIDNDLDVLSCSSTQVQQNEYLPQSSSNLLSMDSTGLNVTDGIEYIAQYKFHNEVWRNIVRREFMIDNGIRFEEGRWLEDAPLVAELFCAANRAAHLDLDMHRYRILPTSAMHSKNPEHYRNLIYDIGYAAHSYGRLIENLPTDHEKYTACRKRLKARQQSFVFFLLIRLMKSDIEVGKISPMLEEFKEIDAYPLNEFLGEDYNCPLYSIMVFIINREQLIMPFTRVFRMFYRLVS